MIFGNSGTSFILNDRRLGDRVSSAKFWTLVQDKTKELSGCGFAPHARVVIEAQEPIATLVNLFAVWECGLCAVLVANSITDEERNRIREFVDASAWMTDHVSVLKVEDGAVSSERLKENDPALILLTSGTTGVPKGVTLSLSALRKRLALNVDAIGASNMSHTLCVLPLSFGHGLIGNTLTAMAANAQISFLVKPTLPELSTLGQNLDEWGVRFLSSVPSFWYLALRVSPRPKNSLQRIHVGSAPLSDELWREIENWSGTNKVFNTYGMTETANWISGMLRDQAGASDGLVGKIWGGSFKVLIDGELKTSGKGEVAISSPTLMLGYWNAEEKTQDVIFEEHFLTGDIGELTKDGALRLVGRLKNEINVGGIKVLAEEVDMLLERNPMVREACSFPISDEVAGEVVAAAIAVNTALESEDVRAWCKERARPEAVPAKLVFVDELPRNDRGKLDRGVAKALFEELIK
ncbi:MAG: fatty acid--CoA ligase family protein [Pseudomonadota bacterium]